MAKNGKTFWCERETKMVLMSQAPIVKVTCFNSTGIR